MKFNPRLSWEFLSTEEIAAKTLRALRNQIKHVKEVSPYYEEAFWDINPDDIKHLDDFHRLPFTGRTSLAEHSDKFVAIDAQDIVETVATSGATGQPILCPLSANDIDRLAFSQALSFNSMGINANDRALLFTEFDRCSLYGMGCYRGLMHLGVQTARAGIIPHDLARQYIDKLKPTLLAGSPPFLRRLALELANAGFNAKESSVTKLICLGESLKGQDMEINSVGKKLQELWDARAFVSYALTEVADALCECSQQGGTHSHPELIYLEIVDGAGKTVSEGTPGELVVTSLGIEAMPLVRYRTGDITFTIKGTCPCERHSPRVGPILGRSTEIIRLKSGTVYPLILTNALDELDEIRDYVIILESDDPHIDRVSIHAATQPSAVEKIAAHVRTAVHVTFPILISNSSTIQSMRGVSQRNVRIIDWRQQGQCR